MLAKNAFKNAKSKTDLVTGAVRMVGAVEKIELEMDVMVLLGELIDINACLIQVCMTF